MGQGQRPPGDTTVHDRSVRADFTQMIMPLCLTAVTVVRSVNVTVVIQSSAAL